MGVNIMENNLDWFNFNLMVPDYDPDDEGDNMETKAQTEANKKWQEKNREHARYLRNRSTARNFIKKQAKIEDIEEIEELIKTRKNELCEINLDDIKHEK